MQSSSDAGGVRTRNREGLSFAAVPVRVPRHALVVRVGLEPTNTEVRAPTYSLVAVAMPIRAPHHA